MFEHEHHQNILLVLNSLKSDLFEQVRAFFGGGTLITLTNEEYRWSKDIDFMCEVGLGYRDLRGYVADNCFKPACLFDSLNNIHLPRDIQANQWGIRFLVVANDTPIKFEIVCEARIKLNAPHKYENIPVMCLDFEDQCSEKLLANADRWADEGIESRDLIDLAILRLRDELPRAAIEKASNAYEVLPSLEKAVRKFLSDQKYQKKCFNALEIQDPHRVMRGIELLENDFLLSGNR